MAYSQLLVALSLAASVLPPSTGAHPAPAPPGTPFTRYCLRVEPVIGSRIETIQCMTRERWAELDVDVDQEWAQNGVRVIT
jgi:hypothetical protein